MNPENNFNANNNDALNNDINSMNNQPDTQMNNNATEIQTPQNNPVETPVAQPQPMMNQQVEQNYQQPMNNMQPNNVAMPMNNQYQMNNQVVQQPYYNNVNQPKKSNKTLFIILGVVAAIVLITAVVGGIFLLSGIVGGKANLSKPDSVAKAYVNALIKKDYKEAKKYVYIPEGGFVNDDDYLDFITRQEYTKTVVDKKVESVTELRLASDTAEYSILTKGEDKLDYTVTVPLVLNDGKWYVNETNLYAKDWKLTVPGGTKVTIDGEEVDKKYITGKEGNYDLYVLPAIAKESKHFELKNDLGQLESDITATNDGKTYQIDMEIKNAELVTKAHEFIKKTWNDIITAAAAKKDLSEIRKYFDDSIDTDTINVYYKNMAGMLSESSGKITNLKMTNVVARKDALNYVSTNDVITLNFGYTVNWTWVFLGNNNYSMDRYSSVRLKVDGDSFKIYQVTDDKIFSWLNQFTNDF